MRTCVAHLNISVGIGALAGVEGLRGVVLLRRSRGCRGSVVLAPKPAALRLSSSSSASTRACTYIMVRISIGLVTGFQSSLLGKMPAPHDHNLAQVAHRSNSDPCALPRHAQYLLFEVTRNLWVCRKHALQTRSHVNGQGSMQ